MATNEGNEVQKKCAKHSQRELLNSAIRFDDNNKYNNHIKNPSAQQLNREDEEERGAKTKKVLRLIAIARLIDLKGG